MSISIVSALPKSVQTTQSDSAASAASTTDSPSSPKDFLALLLNLGQQTLASSLGVSTKDTATEDKADQQAAATEANDPSNLLAALGIIPIEPRTDTAKESATQETATALSTEIGGKVTISGDTKETPNTGSSELSALPTETPKTGQFSDLAAKLVLPGGQDKAAIIADEQTAIPATSTETLVSETNNTPLLQTHSTTPSAGTTQSDSTSALNIRTSVKSENWHQDFSQKIVWMASNETQSARITLNPEQMGPIEVSLSVDKGSATATFVSSNPEVRESIETALPRLREMFAGIGIELGQANVSAESFKQPTTGGEGFSNRSQDDSSNGILSVSMASNSSTGVYAARQGNGLVDIFA